MRTLRLLLAALLFSAAAAAAPINLTGTWQPKYWTIKIALQQDGDRVWGQGGAGDFWFRGHWAGNRLLLVANNFDEKRKDSCKSRGVFSLRGTNVSSVSSLWWQADTNRTVQGPWTRVSPNAGEAKAYPYGTELIYCGSLRTYELAFASDSDKLQGTDWPILSAVAQVLQSHSDVKIEVAGHTDSTGDARKNQELSERRAAAIKQALVEKHGADAARIAVKGWGAQQPIQDNKTEDGRALNRRVEIVLSESQ